jgi:hypothetical protein
MLHARIYFRVPFWKCVPQVFQLWSKQSISWGGGEDWISGRRNLLFKGSRSDLRFTQTPVIWISGATLSEVKQVSRETTRWPPASVKLKLHRIHLLSSTSLYGKAHTQAHERLYLRLTSWGESRYFSVYGATARPKLESGSFTVLCTWIYPILCKFYVGLGSLQLKIRFSLNVTNILDIVHHLRICQAQSLECVFVVIKYTVSLDSLEWASLIHWTLIWYFITHSIHSVLLKLSKCKVTQ